MAPQTTRTNNTSDNKQRTVVIEPNDGTPPFVRCNSSLPFVNPTTPNEKTAKEINQELNLNLGLPIDPNNSKLRKFIRFLNNLFISWWEEYLFAAWDRIPLSVKKKVTFVAWGWYLFLHKRILGRSTAIHPHVSDEYHAMTSLMYWGRLFPVTIQRMRFSLAQLTVWTKTPILSRIERIQEEYIVGTNTHVPIEQKEHCTVHGIYIHTRTGDTQPTERVIFWLYGGAFLSGDVDGNRGPGTVYFVCLFVCVCVSLGFSLDILCSQCWFVPHFFFGFWTQRKMSDAPVPWTSFCPHTVCCPNVPLMTCCGMLLSHIVGW